MSLVERAAVSITDILNESDESDQECMLNQMFLVEDIDIANFYRKLCSRNKLSNGFNRKQKCVSVQTDDVDSSIPPSWLIKGEKLVEELYTGLGNIINSVYYNPQSSNIQDVMKRARLNPAGMKYFTLENGHLRSKLLPNMKIADLNETNTRNSLRSDDTKRSLFHLLEVATKLRNVIPNISYFASCKNVTSEDKMQQSFNETSNVDSLSELGKIQSRNVENSDHIGNMDSVDDLVEIWSDIEECRQKLRDRRKSHTKRVRKDSTHEAVKKKHAVVDDSCGSDEIPGVKVMRYALASRDPNAKSTVDRPLRKENVKAKSSESNFSSGKTRAIIRPDSPFKLSVFPSCSKTKNKIPQCDWSRAVSSSTKQEKRALDDQENSIKSKSSRGNNEKDFIRKNILDLKNKCNRSSSVVIKNCKRDICTESEVMTKNGHRMKS